MSNVIQFLEKMGKDPAMAKLDQDEYAAAVDALGLDDAPRRALLDRDADSLNGLLGGRHKMVCMLFPADGDDNKKDDDQEDGDQPDQDDRKESVRQAGLH